MSEALEQAAPAKTGFFAVDRRIWAKLCVPGMMNEAVATRDFRRPKRAHARGPLLASVHGAYEMLGGRPMCLKGAKIATKS